MMFVIGVNYNIDVQQILNGMNLWISLSAYMSIWQELHQFPQYWL